MGRGIDLGISRSARDSESGDVLGDRPGDPPGVTGRVGGSGPAPRPGPWEAERDAVSFSEREC